MKKIILVIILITGILKVNAQSSATNDQVSIPLSNFYLGIGTGINSLTGMIGLSANLRIHNKLFAQAGIGAGGWGAKYTLGLRYDMNYGSGWSYGMGFSYYPGSDKIKANLELQNGVKSDVYINYLSANTINLTATHNWKMGTRNMFYLSLGYSIAMQSHPWEISDRYTNISSNSENVLNLLSPGGIILGMGFTFGL